MKGNKLEFQSPEDTEAVYYEAFRHCDARVMAALWADGDVICVHPGSGAVVGHTAVARSWAHIFDNAQPPQLTVSVARRTVGDDLAVHVVTEQFASENAATTVVLATNVYRKFDAGWLMIEHHASLVEVAGHAHTLQ